MSSLPSRRTFLKATGAGAAALSLSAVSYANVVGANDRIAIGVIGCGRRANWAHLPGVQKHAKAQNVQFTAVCDPWRPRREQTAAKIKKWTGQAAQQFVSYRDLLAKGNVDAVMIASCDHQHTTHLEAAAKAKKDAYCEKPLAMDLEKLKRACDAVTASGICCQIGTQIRSLPTSRGCQKFFQGGLLGKLSRVEETRNAAKPYWYSRLGKANKRDVEWKEFLMDVPEQPFRADRFTGWYGYREFSDGPVPGLGSHFIDLMNYITGSKLPESCVAHGGTFTWK
ncbi:MAG: Gfo/Idh/MocA family oxidoreductase, partial [Pirellulales bacterium]|nr:Gfo/Idh/MocA family oxidoreductase [Pirellulales bacterium]